jgi:hypothetical protein
MALVRPFIYSVCDREYQARYAKAFLRSARHYGHEAKVFCRDDITVTSKDDMAFFVFWRYELLPELLKTYSHVLLVDIDSVFQGPALVDDRYDVGIFFRNMGKDAEKDAGNRTKTLGGVFYCSQKAMPYADYLSMKMAAAEHVWYADQRVLYEVFCEIGDQYRVKHFGNDFIDWHFPTNAPIYTAKGNRKAEQDFLTKKREWDRR